MKTEQQIKEEIEVTKKSKEKFVEAFKDGRIDNKKLNLRGMKKRTKYSSSYHNYYILL
jgi:hypothetical protein